MLAFAFNMFDTDSKGYILQDELQTLLETVHGDDPLHDGGIDKVMKLFDTNGDGKVDWGEFQDVNRRYPSMFFPIFRLQKAFQSHFLGVNFWRRKMIKFSSARAQLREEKDARSRQRKAERYLEQKRLRKEAKKRQQQLAAGNGAAALDNDEEQAGGSSAAALDVGDDSDDDEEEAFKTTMEKTKEIYNMENARQKAMIALHEDRREVRRTEMEKKKADAEKRKRERRRVKGEERKMKRLRQARRKQQQQQRGQDDESTGRVLAEPY